MERRTFIKGALVASATPAAAWAPPRADDLTTMLREYEIAIRLDKEAWDRELEIAEGAAMKAKPSERVQISRLWHGANENGEKLFHPIYAYSASDIEVHYQENHSRQVMFQPRAIERVEAETARLIREKTEELEQVQEQCRRIKAECGYTEVSERAKAASKTVRAIENAIVNFVPQTLEEAARKARWIIDELDSGRGYLNDREPADLILDIMGPLARAVA